MSSAYRLPPRAYSARCWPAVRWRSRASFSSPTRYVFCVFFNDTATTEIYTLSLHDALPISRPPGCPLSRAENTPAKPDPGHAGEGSAVTESDTPSWGIDPVPERQRVLGVL